MATLVFWVVQADACTPRTINFASLKPANLNCDLPLRKVVRQQISAIVFIILRAMRLVPFATNLEASCVVSMLWVRRSGH